MSLLAETISRVGPLDASAMKEAGRRLDSIAKPLHSLGLLEDIVIQIAGITGNPDFSISKKALAVFCADNGVVEEGVSQSGQEVTAIVAENFLRGKTSSRLMCKEAGIDLYVYDLGMASDTSVCKDYKIARGTQNFMKGPAMTRKQALKALEAGILIAGELITERPETEARINGNDCAQGYQILAAGEMGIGNTTTSSAVASVLLDSDPALLCGRGAGLCTEGLRKKTEVIRRAIELYKPDPGDPVDVLAKVGGFDIGAMTGFYLGAASRRIPVVLDGLISCAAALLAAGLCPAAADYLIASHVSKEPASGMLLKRLGKKAIIHGEMCLGEGTGAVALFPLMEMGLCVYRSMSTFEEIHVEQYKEQF